MSAADERLEGIQAVLYQRTDAYHGLGLIGDRTGAELWAHCARSAAWARLVAESWSQVADRVPSGLLGTAAMNSVFFYDAEAMRWRSLARDVAAELGPAR